MRRDETQQDSLFIKYGLYSLSVMADAPIQKQNCCPGGVALQTIFRDVWYQDVRDQSSNIKVVMKPFSWYLQNSLFGMLLLRSALQTVVMTSSWQSLGSASK
jgi:hypothetical protein